MWIRFPKDSDENFDRPVQELILYLWRSNGSRMDLIFLRSNQLACSPHLTAVDWEHHRRGCHLHLWSKSMAGLLGLWLRWGHWLECFWGVKKIFGIPPSTRKQYLTWSDWWVVSWPWQKMEHVYGRNHTWLRIGVLPWRLWEVSFSLQLYVFGIGLAAFRGNTMSKESDLLETKSTFTEVEFHSTTGEKREQFF